MERGKKVVRNLLICVGAVFATILVDFVVQDYIYKNKFAIVEDDFSHVFQVDSFEIENNEAIITGWVFELDKHSIEDDFDIILYDYNNDKYYYTEIEDVIRKDVNDYFLCEYDYSNSGFVTKIKNDSINLYDCNYEVLFRPCNEQKAYKSGMYISKGKIMFVKPEEYVALDVDGTCLEQIVSEGILRLYRADEGMYIYQYNGKFYWIADDNYEYEYDGTTYIQYRVITTQVEKIPMKEFDEERFMADLGFYFEGSINEELSNDKYKVVVREIPTEYSIAKIWTGYFYGWKWQDYFRPRYEFD